MTEQRQNSDSTSSTSNSTNYYYQHGAGRVLSEIDKLAICSAYRANLGHELRSPMAARFGALWRDGMEADVIIHAIEITGLAPKPTPYYLQAILYRYETEGLKSMVAVEEDEWNYKQRQKHHEEDLPW